MCSPKKIPTRVKEKEKVKKEDLFFFLFRFLYAASDEKE
jgi:hypothetical protein